MQVLPGDHVAFQALKRCRQFYVKLNDFVAVKELSELSSQIDMTRFSSDEAYRNSILLEQCHSMKEGTLERALKLAEKYRLSRFDVLAEYIHWALTEGYTAFTKDSSRFGCPIF